MSSIEQEAASLVELFFKEINDTDFMLCQALVYKPEIATRAIQCAIKHCELAINKLEGMVTEERLFEILYYKEIINYLKQL
jgi:hypothetical protein